MENRRTKLIIILLLTMLYSNGFAQSQQYICEYDIISDNVIRIKSVHNKDSNHFIKVYVDGANDNALCGTVSANGSLVLDKDCSRFVKVEVQGGSMKTILDAKAILQDRMLLSEKDIVAQQTQDPPGEDTTNKKEAKIQKSVAGNKYSHDVKSSVEASEVMRAFSVYVESIPYYSELYYKTIESDVISFVDAMRYMEPEMKENYIREKKLNGYVLDSKNDVKQQKNNVEQLIDDFLNYKYHNVTIKDKQRCLDEMHDYLLDKIKEREDVIKLLEDALPSNPSMSLINQILNDKSLLLNVGIVAFVLLTLLIIIIRVVRKGNAKKPTILPSDIVSQNAQADIVVRRKTTSILKKQSLEDVENNSAYFKIDCSDFCDDSAVRRIYFKNTCIRDIYNMYADDLRNPENPNEDGCMVLGRWVHDAETDEYYVSLEEIIKPGDDAVFKEYELNFGGKIKLKVSEKLRKLRRDTNLQYDMTCWVHSHPGLGVFFSNADSGVQMQLKHPTHPKFLIAIVVDILTPKQEFGIFTFKHDLSINSKPELKKMYSLEDLYKWAMSSDRSSFKVDDYYNMMHSTKDRVESCYGVHLSNGAIIDMCHMEAEQQTGLVGWAQGFNYKKGTGNEWVIRTVTKDKVATDNDMLGCFMVDTHRSLPTIRKNISNVDLIKFVLFYSTFDGLLTVIPVIDGQISADETVYGEEKLEELKIWTRRKR